LRRRIENLEEEVNRMKKDVFDEIDAICKTRGT
jgi:hypothetical protein